MASTGSTTITIGADIKQFLASLDSITTRMEDLQKASGNVKIAVDPASMAQLTQGMDSIRNSIALFAPQLQNLLGGLASGVQSSYRNFAEFDAMIRRAGASTGATAAQVDALAKAADNVGAGSEQGISALGELGFNADEIAALLPQLNQLSRVTGTDISKAAQVAGLALSAFDKDVSDANHVMDVLGSVTAKTALTMDQLAVIFDNVSGYAKANNVSFEQTVAILGKLSDEGLTARQAATKFKEVVESGADLSKITASFGEFDGAVNNMAASLNDSAGQAIYRLQSSLGTLENAFGRAASEGLTPLINALLPAIDAISNFVNENKTLAAVALLSVSALSAIAGAMVVIGQVAVGLTALASGWKLVGASVASAAGGMTLQVVALNAATALSTGTFASLGTAAVALAAKLRLAANSAGGVLAALTAIYWSVNRITENWELDDKFDQTAANFEKFTNQPLDKQIRDTKTIETELARINEILDASEGKWGSSIGPEQRKELEALKKSYEQLLAMGKAREAQERKVAEAQAAQVSAAEATAKELAALAKTKKDELADAQALVAKGKEQLAQIEKITGSEKTREALIAGIAAGEKRIGEIIAENAKKAAEAAAKRGEAAAKTYEEARALREAGDAQTDLEKAVSGINQKYERITSSIREQAEAAREAGDAETERTLAAAQTLADEGRRLQIINAQEAAQKELTDRVREYGNELLGVWQSAFDKLSNYLAEYEKGELKATDPQAFIGVLQQAIKETKSGLQNAMASFDVKKAFDQTTGAVTEYGRNFLDKLKKREDDYSRAVEEAANQADAIAKNLTRAQGDLENAQKRLADLQIAAGRDGKYDANETKQLQAAGEAVRKFTQQVNNLTTQQKSIGSVRDLVQSEMQWLAANRPTAEFEALRQAAIGAAQGLNQTHGVQSSMPLEGGGGVSTKLDAGETARTISAAVEPLARATAELPAQLVPITQLPTNLSEALTAQIGAFFENYSLLNTEFLNAQLDGYEWFLTSQVDLFSQLLSGLNDFLSAKQSADAQFLERFANIASNITIRVSEERIE